MYKPLKIKTIEVVGIYHALRAMRNPRMSHAKSSTEADIKLASKLILAGDEHAKAIRGIIAYIELDCQIGWFVEWSTYRIGVDVLSTSSTMMIDLAGKKGEELAELKQKELSNVVYHQTALISYQTLRRIYFQRIKHRHPDWQVFCNWIETLPYTNELIIV